MIFRLWSCDDDEPRTLCTEEAESQWGLPEYDVENYDPAPGCSFVSRRISQPFLRDCHENHLLIDEFQVMSGFGAF